MGDWTFVVSGSGSHHNGLPYDVDRLAQRFVNDLVENQHQVRVATATFGGLGFLDTITPERDRYRAQLDAAARRDPVKNPHDEIPSKVAAADDYIFRREQAMALLNLLPGALGKAYWDEQTTRGLVKQYRHSKDRVRESSIDGGETWELAPDPEDAVTIVADINVVGYTPTGEALILRGEAINRLGGDPTVPEPTRSAGAAASSILADGTALCVHCQHFEGEHDKKDGRCRRRLGKVKSGTATPPQCVCTGFVPWVAPRVVTGGAPDPMDGPLPIIGGVGMGSPID